MKKLMIVLLVLFAGSSVVAQDDGVKLAEKLWLDYSEKLKSGDTDGLLEMFNEGAIVIFPSNKVEVVQGKEEIYEVMVTMKDHKFTQWDWKMKHVAKGENTLAFILFLDEVYIAPGQEPSRAFPWVSYYYVKVDGVWKIDVAHVTYKPSNRGI